VSQKFAGPADALQYCAGVGIGFRQRFVSRFIPEYPPRAALCTENLSAHLAEYY